MRALWQYDEVAGEERPFARTTEATSATAPLTEPGSQRRDRPRCNHRLLVFGDRQLNRALYLVAITKQRCDPATKAYIARRVAEGKTDREAIRCLKRFLARRVWRLLEHPPIST